MAPIFLSRVTRYSIILTLISLILAGCGGGGSGNDSTQTPQAIGTTDTTNPEISLNGQAIVNLEQGATFTDAGATATDNIDGSINPTVSGTVGTAVDTYTLTYTATDTAGNSSSVIRTVNVMASSSAVTSINAAKWHHQTRLPNGSGWYNNEQQHYTNRADNSYISNGSLKIVAKKETYQELRVLTHSITEYQEMLHEAGFKETLFYTANPDYKLPVKIFPIKEDRCNINQYILNERWIQEHDGTNGEVLEDQELLKSMSKSFAGLNTLQNFVPSYFIEAS